MPTPISMTYRQLGRSGLTVSAVGLGCNAFGATIEPDRVGAVVDAAFDVGITLFDTADIYGGEPGQSEKLLGAALRGRREDVVVATKFGMDARGLNGEDWSVRGSRRYIRKAVEASLRRLQVDHIDLYQMHAYDPVTPLEETLSALHELVTEGKVRYLGSSNYAGWQVLDADWIARSADKTPMISVQNEYSLLSRGIERELIPAAERVGAGLLPYFPLASGLLTGKYRRGEEAPEGTRLARRPERLEAADFEVIEAIGSFADARGIAMASAAIGFLAAQPVVGSVICGASRPEQVRSNAAALAWSPSTADLGELSQITGPAA